MRGGAQEPNWAALHFELKRPHVTLMLLWEEHRAAAGDKAYGYSRFCDLYRTFEGRLSPSMRQAHAAGDKMFVDYAGATVPVLVDRMSGETRAAQIFVAVLGASNLTYAEASWTQSSADWVNAHVRALEYFGGAPNLVVADNLKAAIVKAWALWRRGCASQKTRPRSKSPSRSSSAGFSRACAIGASLP